MMQPVIDDPHALPDATEVGRNALEQEARMAMPVKVFEPGRLTRGQAAQLAGVLELVFIFDLHRYALSPIQATPYELAERFANA
jgi:hypothetical protein